MIQPGNTARIEHAAPGRYAVEIGAVDIGTGTWTALTQIAADVLGCDVDAVDLQIGDTDLPSASVEGGSSGISSWGRGDLTLRHRHFGRSTATTAGRRRQPPPRRRRTTRPRATAMYSFGAQFAEARVNRYTGEIHVSRMLGVFSVGRVINPTTLRSQLIGGMTMGLSMALHEESVRDHRFGHVVTQDLASYHISSHADIPDIDAIWLDERRRARQPDGLPRRGRDRHRRLRRGGGQRGLPRHRRARTGSSGDV